MGDNTLSLSGSEKSPLLILVLSCSVSWRNSIGELAVRNLILKLPSPFLLTYRHIFPLANDSSAWRDLPNANRNSFLRICSNAPST